MYQGRDFGVGTLKYISVKNKMVTFVRYGQRQRMDIEGFSGQ